MWARSYVVPDGAGRMVRIINYRHCVPPPVLSCETIDSVGL
jgi:hypothetical protein